MTPNENPPPVAQRGVTMSSSVQATHQHALSPTRLTVAPRSPSVNRNGAHHQASQPQSADGRSPDPS